MKVKDYQLIEEIGSGSFSIVYKAKHIKTKKLYAIKKMKEMPRNDEEVVRNQIELLKKMKHKNIISYETDFKENGKWYIVLEYCGKGDLQHFKKKQQKIPQEFIKNIFYSILQAVDLIHHNKIVHRDLKMANILITDQYEIKLTDFGFSKDCQGNLMQSYCGTPLTMSPEILQRKPYDERCDTWSLGVLLYQLIYSKAPFMPSKQFGVGLIGLTNAVLKGHPSFDEHIQISHECKTVILKCLQKDMLKRPFVSDLKRYPWFQSGIKSKIRKDFFQAVSSDKGQIINSFKLILNKGAALFLKKFIQQTKLSDTTIKQNCRIMTKNYKQSENICMYYLARITESLTKLNQFKIKIKIQGLQFNIKLNHLYRFKKHLEHLKQFLKRQLANFKFQQTMPQCSDVVLLKFVLNNIQQKINDGNKEDLNLFVAITQTIVTEIEQSQVNINCYLDQEDSILKQQLRKFIEQQSSQSITEIINNQEHLDDPFQQNWLIQVQQFKNKKIDNDDDQISELIIANSLLAALKINLQMRN